MPQRALPKPPKVPKLTTIEEPPQLDSPKEVERFPRVERDDQRLGNRKKHDDSLRGQPGGPFISPYLHQKRQDPSRQRREDGEQREKIRELLEQRREINDQIWELRNQDTRINPYNVEPAESVFQQMLSDLRNMEQTNWSGNLSGYYGYSPLKQLFEEQFSVSEEDE